MGCHFSSALADDVAFDNDNDNNHAAGSTAGSTKRSTGVVVAADTKDASPPPQRPLPTKEELQRDDSMYFDAVMTQEEINELADELFTESHNANLDLVYAPADSRDRHKRASIIMEEPETLLLLLEEEEEDNDQHAKSRRATLLIKEGLTAPKLKMQLEGYPGDLTETELSSCLEFRQLLKSRPTHYDMVHAWDPVEEEPYALCRFLRARQFHPPDVLKMMDENIELFEKAQSNSFYKDIDAHLGCPLSVFLSQYPYLYSGSSKNGCVVAYFRAGQVNVDGIDCCSDLETKLVRYLWYGLKYAFPEQVVKQQQQQQDGRERCECFFVADLAGLSASTLNSRTMGVFKKLAEATGSFPEILNKTIVLNAPGYFAFSWRIMKAFLHPRTAAKIEIYSDANQGKKRVQELVDKSELLSDYGGTSSSFEQVARPNGVLRQVTNCLTFTKSGSFSSAVTELSLPNPIQLSSGEEMHVSVYTRSTLGADVVVVSGKNDVIAKTKAVSSDAQTPRRVDVATNVKGPGTFTITLTTKQATKSKEHFLVVVNVVEA